jgi:hypothetical protein
MRSQGRIYWSPSLKPSIDQVASLEFGLASSAELYPSSGQPIAPPDEAVFLLHIAAEVEHALMLQYLYAMFSFGPPRELPKEQQTWVTSLRTVAMQEMGHLMTVQNIAIALGGPITFEREEYPSQSDFYPFPFSLERPTRDVFAKYVVAEMPPYEAIPSSLRPLVNQAMIRSELANGGVSVNRVGALYAKLIEIVGQLCEADFNFGTAATFQAAPEELSGTSGPNPEPPQTPMNSMMTWPIDSKDTAVKALELIATQGEGATRCEEGSHFARFLNIFQCFPETNPLFGQVGPNPTRPVPTNPIATDAAPFDTANITDPISLPLAQFANLRYRLLLGMLSHYLQIDRTRRPNCKRKLGTKCTSEMVNTISPVAIALTSLSRQQPTLYGDDGNPLVAAFPFEMPYTLSLSPDESMRWQSHIDLLQQSDKVAKQLVKSAECPDEVTATLKTILGHDSSVIAMMQDAADDPQVDCSGR